jgi:hypothetical protein
MGWRKAMRRTLARASVVLGTVGVLIVVIAGIASAVEFNPNATLDPSQVQDKRCQGTVCLFRDQDFSGPSVQYVTGSKDMSRNGPYFNDQATSIRNWTSSRFCFYENPDYKGRVWYLDGMTQTRNVGTAANDIISSVRKC